MLKKLKFRLYLIMKSFMKQKKVILIVLIAFLTGNLSFSQKNIDTVAGGTNKLNINKLLENSVRTDLIGREMWNHMKPNKKSIPISIVPCKILSSRRLMQKQVLRLS